MAQAVRSFFPQARLVSLYDEYNIQNQQAANSRFSEIRSYTAAQRKNFRKSLIEILCDDIILPATAQEGVGFLLIAESLQVKEAQLMVAQLERKGLIERRGEEVLFVNSLAENPLYQNIRLRTAKGRWLCEALDASAFFKSENQIITHMIVLPNYMKSQQDKVWEIIRVLGIPMHNYHNIFYDPTQPPAKISAAITAALKCAEQSFFNQYQVDNEDSNNKNR